MANSLLLWPILQIPLTALASALLTSHLQNRDYRHRKHWELRVVAYQELIDALSGVELYYEAAWKAALRGEELSEDAEKRLGPGCELGFAKVRQAQLRGPFLYSEGVERALHIYLDERGREPTWLDHVEGEWSAAARCRSDIVGASKRDLEVPSSWAGRVWKSTFARRSKETPVSTDC